MGPCDNRGYVPGFRDVTCVAGSTSGYAQNSCAPLS